LNWNLVSVFGELRIIISTKKKLVFQDGKDFISEFVYIKRRVIEHGRCVYFCHWIERLDGLFVGFGDVEVWLISFLKEKRSESGDGGEEDHKECLYSEDLNFWCSHRGTILSRRLIGTSSTLSFVDLFICIYF